MGFVDKQNDRVQAAFDLFDHRLEAVLELTFDPGTGLQQPQVQGMQGNMLEHRRHITLGDAQGQPFDDGGFADAGFTGEDRVVLAAAGQDIDHLPYLELAAQNRVDATFAGTLGQVDGVLVKGRGFAVAFAGRRDCCRWACQRAGELRLGAAFDQGGEVQAQVIRVDFLQLRRRGDDHPAQLGVIEQRLQQMSGADLPLAELDRGQYPGLFNHPGDMR
ncbi:hypothetical protein D3C81_718880 [compost metagenome]